MLIIAGSLFLCGRASAQSAEVGNWWIYFGNLQLDARWNIWHEVQYRCYDVAGDLEQLLLRGGVGYNLSENNNNVLLGYAYIYGRPYVQGTGEKTTTWENRIYQQFLTRQRFGRVYIAHRYRIEERLRNEDMDVRFRYFLSVNVPLNKPEMVPGAFYASAYDEIFLNADAPVFDRNRLYGALGYVIRPTLRGEFGFMRQMLEQGGRNQFQVVLFNTFDLARHTD
jgi:hypothetical protein